MFYENSNLSIQSDFPIRTIDQGHGDLDLIIPLDSRVVNLFLPDLPSYIKERLQFTEVSSIMFRFNTDPGNNLTTIHLLRSIDMSTPLVNFILDYSSLTFQIRDCESYIDFLVSENK